MRTELMLRVVGGPFEQLTRADLTRLVYWIETPQSLTVGRSDATSQVAVHQDARMSGQHFKITFEDTVWRITDLKSKHGTHVAGELVESTELCDGDLIRAGETTFRVGIPTAASRGGMANIAAIGGKQQSSPLEGSPPQSSLLSDAGMPVADPRDTVEFVEPIQLIIRIQTGPFDQSELTNLTRLLNWIGPGESIVVGRTYQSDMVVRQDKRISSRHFEITCDTATARVRDLGSSNGTYLHGLPIDSTQLAHADEITAGDTTFGISIMGGAQAKGAGLETTATIPIRPMSARDTASNGAFDPLQAVLSIESGPFDEGTMRELSRVLNWFSAGETIVVGHATFETDNRIRQDAKLAGRHFEVHCDGWMCHLRDLDSAGGTYLNDEQIFAAILRDGDVIAAGETTFRVKIKGGPSITDAEVALGLVKPGPTGLATDETSD